MNQTQAAGGKIMNRSVSSVARYILRSMLTVFLVHFAYSCHDAGPEPDQPWLADHSDIADPAKRWAAYGVQDYAIVQTRNCFCPDGGKRFLITVRSGNIVSVVDLSNESNATERAGAFKTVAQLFDLIKSIDTTHVASFQASYDARYGYPLKIYVDPNARIADDEYGYETSIVSH